MPDAAEGLVDAEARIQERMEDLAQQRKAREMKAKDPQRAHAVESFRLARIELERQLELTTHAVRRKQIGLAMAELDRRIAEASRLAG